MAVCGNGETHCCWLAGNVCSHLEVNTVSGRKWACGLRRKYGDWDKVINSDEYLLTVEPKLGPQGVNCKTWPDLEKGQFCGDCGLGCDK